MTPHPSGRAMELYHATYTGTKNDILHSFREGARADMSLTGKHQGSGFYAWTNKDFAKVHAKDVLKERDRGSHMLVTVEDAVVPGRWKLDVEAHAHILSRLVYDNFHTLFQTIPDGAIDTGRGSLYPSKSHRLIYEEKMRLKFRKASGSFTQKTYNADVARNLDNGVFFDMIFEELRSIYPVLMDSVETELFQRITRSNTEYALKYIGQEPLPVKKLEVLVGKDWVETDFNR